MTKRSVAPGMTGRVFGLLAASTLCWSPDDPPVPPPPVPPAPPPAPPEQRPIVFNTQEAFNERVAQASRAHLRDKYGLSEKDLDARLKLAKDLEDAEAARLKASQTREQQLEAEKTEAESRAKAAEARATEAQRHSEVTTMCARHGFKNVDYAVFEATRSAKTGAELEAHFVEMAKDATKKAALGLDVPPAELVPVPVGTAPIGTPPAPPPPPPGGGTPPAVDVFAMTPQQFAAHVQTVHRG